jgi:hypothetical protein
VSDDRDSITNQLKEQQMDVEGLQAINAGIKRLYRADALLRQIWSACNRGEVDGLDLDWMVACDEYFLGRDAGVARQAIADAKEGRFSTIKQILDDLPKEEGDK